MLLCWNGIQNKADLYHDGRKKNKSGGESILSVQVLIQTTHKYQVAWEVDMSAEWYKEQPTNRNFLNPIGYLLKLEKFEGVDFFCQSANVPDVTMPTTEVASRFRSLPIIPGGGVTFGDFSVRFIVDEDLKNYYSIHSWMRDCGNADQMPRTTAEDDIYTGGQLHIVTSAYNPAFVVEFRNLFPVALTNLQFDATISDVEYLTAEVTFKHQQFFIRDKDMKPL